MANTEDVKLRLKLEKAKQFQSGMNGASSSVDRFGRKSKKAAASARLLSSATGKVRSANRALASGIKLGLGSAFAAAGAEAFRATKGYTEHLAVVRRTNAVLRSTGHISGTTTTKVNRLTDALERQTGLDGDLIQKGANMLLTFTNVRNGVGKNSKIFDEATKTLTGMTQALGGDPEKNAIRLGKALNDPVKGITALKKVGVTFDAQQQKTIEKLVKSGKTMEAQKMILRELNKEFPKVKATPFQRLTVIVRQLEDALGKFLLPIFEKGTRKLQRFLDQAQKGTGTGGAFVKKVKEIGQAINAYFIVPISKAITWITKSNDRVTALAIGIGVITAAMIAFGVATALAAAPAYLLIAAIGLVAAGLYYAYQRSETFRNVLHGIGDAATFAWKFLKHVPAIEVIRHLGDIVSFVKSMPGKISKAATGIWDGFKGGLVSVINWVIGKINWLIRAFNNTAGRIPGVGNIGELGTVGPDQGVTDANTKASEGYTGTGAPTPKAKPAAKPGNADRPAGGGGRGSARAANVSVFMDSEEVGYKVVKRTRNRARRR